MDWLFLHDLKAIIIIKDERTYRMNNIIERIDHQLIMKSIKSYMYTPQEIKLADELADALNDKASLSFYLAATKKHNHRYLRNVLAHVLAIPNYAITKSRGALFNHIISEKGISIIDNETEEFNNPWD